MVTASWRTQSEKRSRSEYWAKFTGCVPEFSTYSSNAFKVVGVAHDVVNEWLTLKYIQQADHGRMLQHTPVQTNAISCFTFAPGLFIITNSSGLVSKPPCYACKLYNLYLTIWRSSKQDSTVGQSQLTNTFTCLSKYILKRKNSDRLINIAFEGRGLNWSLYETSCEYKRGRYLTELTGVRPLYEYNLPSGWYFFAIYYVYL